LAFSTEKVTNVLVYSYFIHAFSTVLIYFRSDAFSFRLSLAFAMHFLLDKARETLQGLLVLLLLSKSSLKSTLAFWKISPFLLQHMQAKF